MKKEKLERLLYFIEKIEKDNITTLTDEERKELLNLADSYSDIDADYSIHDNYYISLYYYTVLENDELIQYLENNENNKFRARKNNEEIEIEEVIIDMIRITKNGIYTIEYIETETNNIEYITADIHDVIEYIEDNLKNKDLTEYKVYKYDDTTFLNCIASYTIIDEIDEINLKSDY